MSFNFGFTKRLKMTGEQSVKPLRKPLNYVFHYSSISTSLLSPYEFSSGYPNIVMPTSQKGDTTFTVVTHTFDNDDQILRADFFMLMYVLKLYHGDGTTDDALNIDAVHYFDTSVKNCGNVFFLNKSYKISDKITSVSLDNLVGFEFKWKMITSGKTYGNESSVNIVVDY